MSRMKTFFIYAVLIVAFYFLSNILIYLFIKGTYKDITGEIAADNIEVVKAEATYVNGYIDGKITLELAKAQIETRNIEILNRTIAQLTKRT